MLGLCPIVSQTLVKAYRWGHKKNFGSGYRNSWMILYMGGFSLFAMYVCTKSVRTYIAFYPKCAIYAILYKAKVVWAKVTQANRLRSSPHFETWFWPKLQRNQRTDFIRWLAGSVKARLRYERTLPFWYELFLYAGNQGATEKNFGGGHQNSGVNPYMRELGLFAMYVRT